MATKIVTKNSSTASAVPTASDLVQGELAVNVADKRLFTEDNGGSIVELGTKPSTIDINAGSIDGTAIGASSASTGAFTTLTASGLTVDTNTLAVDSTNNRVGIGTASPTEKLEIQEGNVAIRSSTISQETPFYFMRDDSGQTADYVASIGMQAASSSDWRGVITFNAKSGSAYNNTTIVERMRIDASGNVGIGTTSPRTSLNLTAASSNPPSLGTASGGLTIAQVSNNYGLNMGVAGTGTSWIQSMRFDGTATAYPLVLQANGGNVGIGTSSSINNSLLNVNGGINTTSGIVGTLTSDSFTLNGETQPHYGINFAPTNGRTVGISGYNGISFASSGSERARIDSSGNLLVGQTAQNYNVVGASIGSDGLIRAACTNQQATAFNRKGNDGVISVFYKDGVNVGSISTNANSLPSDRNFKRNIQDLTLGLDFVESLNPVTYNFKIDDEGQAVMTGLIAQEVEESLTAAGVEKNSMTLLQHAPTEDVNESDYQMDYLKFVPILINSIKEQQTLIESLTARIAALEE